MDEPIVTEERHNSSVYRNAQIPEEIPTLNVEFEGAEFPASMMDVGFTRTGDLVFRMRINHRFRHLGLALADTYTRPVMVTVKPLDFTDD